VFLVLFELVLGIRFAGLYNFRVMVGFVLLFWIFSKGFTRDVTRRYHTELQSILKSHLLAGQDSGYRKIAYSMMAVVHSGF
jgi:hypothetical protein